MENKSDEEAKKKQRIDGKRAFIIVIKTPIW
jgi:hypothetical protein